MPPRKTAAIRLARAIKALKVLAAQTAVHRKKFEYSLVLFTRFSDWYSSKDQDEAMPKTESKVMTEVFNILTEFRGILAQYILQTWTLPTIEKPSNFVYDQLVNMFDKFYKCALQLDESIAERVKPSKELWNDYHVLDLRAITASFASYIQLEDQDSEMKEKVMLRLAELTTQLAEFDQTEKSTRAFSPIPMAYQKWRVQLSDFEFEKEIGSGLSANVFLGTNTKTGEKVALKRFKFLKLNGSRLQYFQREVAVLAVLSKYEHPCLIHFVGATDTPPFTIITEYMPNGSLFDDVRTNHILNPTQLSIAAYDIARGMKYLHSCKIVHRDLKALNILLDKDWHARICDFGFSRSAGGEDSFKSQNMGTPQWMAPEILQSSRHYTSKIDVYAYAILLTEMLTGTRPYPGYDDPKELRRKVVEDDIRPVLPQSTTPQMRDLITQCWARDPELRPPFDEIVRRFESLEIYFEGTDIQEFGKYIEESKSNPDQLRREWIMTIESCFKGDIEFSDAVNNVAKLPVTSEIVDNVWDFLIAYITNTLHETCDVKQDDDLPQFDTYIEPQSPVRPQITRRDIDAIEDISSVCKLCSSLAATNRIGDTVSILRQLPNGSVPLSVVTQYVKQLPTGNAEIDSAITAVACRNGGAASVVLVARNPKDLEAAIETAHRQGIDPSLKSAVLDRCMQLISESTPMECRIAAARCLIANDGSRRLSTEQLEYLVESPDGPLRSLGYVALSSTEPPIGLLEKCIQKINTDPRAAFVCLRACKFEKTASIVLDKIDEIRNPVFVVKVLAMAIKFPKFLTKCGEIASQPWLQESEDALPLINAIMHVVKS